jgi:integrase
MKGKTGMKHRGHGDGSIYYRESDKRWTCSLILPTGKRKYLYGKTRKEVQDKLRKAQQAVEQGTLVQSTAITFGSYLESWLEARRSTIKAVTYTSYHSHLYRHVMPILGSAKLQKLTDAMLQHFYSHLLEDELSPNTVRLIHTIISTALDDAVKWKKIAVNPCKNVMPPRPEKREMRVLTPEQAQRLLDVAENHRLHCLLTVAITTGMRRGELLALRWSDIHFETARLQVQRTVSYVHPDQVHKHAYVETDPKTASSRRSISLPQFVLDALKQHRKRQLERRLNLGEKWQEHDLVFCNTFGGHYGLSVLFKEFKQLLKLAGLPNMRFHDLRHSAATILLLMGVHPKIVQEILGHSNVSITLNVYSHVLPSLQREAMDQLDKRFKPFNTSLDEAL